MKYDTIKQWQHITFLYRMMYRVFPCVKLSSVLMSSWQHQYFEVYLTNKTLKFLSQDDHFWKLCGLQLCIVHETLFLQRQSACHISSNCMTHNKLSVDHSYRNMISQDFLRITTFQTFENLCPNVSNMLQVSNVCVGFLTFNELFQTFCRWWLCT